MGIKQYSLPQNDTSLPDVNVFWDDQSKIIFDCGPANILSFLKFVDEFNNDGFQLSDIRRIVITHHHIDHIGGLRFFPKNIPVIIQKNSIDFQNIQTYQVIDTKKILKNFDSSNLFNKNINNIAFRILMEYDDSKSLENRQVSFIHKQEIEFEGWTLIPSRGHSSSDLICYNRQQNVAITGDIILPNIFFNSIIEFDLEKQRPVGLRGEFMTELNTILGLSPEIVFIGHGHSLNLDEVKRNILNTTKRMKRTEKKVLKSVNENLNVTETVELIFRNFIPYEYFLPFSEVLNIYLENDLLNN